jgi:hypothetical protein
MNSTMILICLWSASAALGAFLIMVVKPKWRAFAEIGNKERDRIWACMDQVAARKGSLRLLGPLVTEEQRAFEGLRGAVSLEALEKRCREFQNAGFLLVALEVDAGILEAALELSLKRHGRFLYWYFMRSTAVTARRMVNSARDLKKQLLVQATGEIDQFRTARYLEKEANNAERSQ